MSVVAKFKIFCIQTCSSGTKLNLFGSSLFNVQHPQMSWCLFFFWLLGWSVSSSSSFPSASYKSLPRTCRCGGNGMMGRPDEMSPNILWVSSSISPLLFSHCYGNLRQILSSMGHQELHWLWNMTPLVNPSVTVSVLTHPPLHWCIPYCNANIKNRSQDNSSYLLKVSCVPGICDTNFISTVLC